MPTRQILTTRTALAATTEYLSPGILDAASTTEAVVSHQWLGQARATGLRVTLDAAPGVGKSRTFAFRVDGVDTALTLTISGTDTAASIVASVAIADGDLVSLAHVPAGSPSITDGRISLVIDGSESFVSCYGGGIDGAVLVSDAFVYKQGVFGANGWGAVGSVSVRNLVPVAGTITRVAVNVTTAPGSGKSIAFDVFVNDVLTGIGLTVSGTATSAVVTCAIAVVEGHRVHVEAQMSAGAAPTEARMAYRFETALDGASIITSPGGAQALASLSTRYSPPRQYNQVAAEADATVLGGLETFELRNLHAHIWSGATGTDPHVVTVRRNSAATALTVTTPAQPAVTEGDAPPDLLSRVSIGSSDTWDIGLVNGDTGPIALLNWAVMQYAPTTGAPDGGVIGAIPTARSSLPEGWMGPHAWVEWPRIVPTATTNFYSDQDMQCPGSYYGGFKEARVIAFGNADRALSHPWTGDWTGSTFSLQLSDYDRSIRERFASPTGRYWSEPLTVRMISRAARATLRTPYTPFVGPIIDATPTKPLAWDLTLGDIVSHTVLYDQGLLPWRLIRDGCLDQLSVVSDSLDSETPEPIIYGIHRRVPGIDPASPQGFCVTPTYLGIMDVSGDDFHVWLLASHACADVPDIRVDTVSVIADEGTQWLVPHHTGHDTEFGAPYIDFPSSTYGNDRRYSLIFGLVTDLEAAAPALTDPDACALGHKQLTVEVEGIEPNGDGTGDAITDRILQYEDFLINYVAHRGPDGYQSGARLTTPSWALFDGDVPVIDEASFDACSAIGVERLPFFDDGSGTPAGYVGAAVIGARAGDRAGVRRWIASWNRSCGVRFGITHFGQIRICMLHPTAAIKAAAPLIRDATEILAGSFDTHVRWSEQANRIPFRADYNHATGVWTTTDVAEDLDAITNYARELLGEQREYAFAPGITMAYHLARLELLTTTHPPRTIVFEAPVVDERGETLASLDLGDYFRYRHFASVSSGPASIRLAQVVRHQVQVGARRVRIEALDCEDLLGYDGTPAGEALAAIADPVTTGMEDWSSMTSMTAVDLPV